MVSDIDSNGVLTRKEKEELVLDLYFNQIKTMREIAKIARMSPRDIKPIIDKAINEKERREHKSTAVQAYELFPQGKTLLQPWPHRTVSKGWDLLKKMNIPYGWKVIVNSSKDHYNTEKYDLNFISNAHSSRRRRSNNDNNSNIINLQSDFLEERDFSLLLYACDVILLPYRITSGSGVMFDALAHGIPFIASDLAFFREFAGQGLGIVVNRNPTAFSDGIKKLERNYSYYSQNVHKFKEKLKWNCVASEHKSAYSSIKIPQS
jgi:hypothetical protein